MNAFRLVVDLKSNQILDISISGIANPDKDVLLHVSKEDNKAIFYKRFGCDFDDSYILNRNDNIVLDLISELLLELNR